MMEDDFMDTVHRGCSQSRESDMVSRLHGCVDSLSFWSKSLNADFKNKQLKCLQDRRDDEGVA